MSTKQSDPEQNKKSDSVKVGMDKDVVVDRKADVVERLVMAWAGVGEQVAGLVELGVGLTKMDYVQQRAKADAAKNEPAETVQERTRRDFVHRLQEESSSTQHLSVTWWMDGGSTFVSEAYSIPRGCTIAHLQQQLVKESRYLQRKTAFKKADSKEVMFDWNSVDIVSLQHPRTALMESFRLDSITHPHLVVRCVGADNSRRLFEEIQKLEEHGFNNHLPSSKPQHQQQQQYLTDAHFS